MRIEDEDDLRLLKIAKERIKNYNIEKVEIE